MQTTADAAAMAGGRYLGEGGTPNWTTATAQAQAMLASNLVDGKVITDASIQTGYWD
ncbi:MAG: pilus assembly protein TadE, partial [Betaproteobacteria bacterium]|nr:pilus assembly protein TadE [Betaproteobacteria bacterium]